jgi:hypothetical protein
MKSRRPAEPNSLLLPSTLGRRPQTLLADNDEGGRQHAERKAALIARTAQSVKVVHFPELPEKGDVSDWVELGHGAEDLRKRVAAALPWQPPAGADRMVVSAQRQQLVFQRTAKRQRTSVVSWRPLSGGLHAQFKNAAGHVFRAGGVLYGVAMSELGRCCRKMPCCLGFLFG